MQDITPSAEEVERALSRMKSPDARERLTELLDRFNRIVIEHEAEYRAALRVYLDTWFAARRACEEGPSVRAGRRRRWLDIVLEPLRGSLPEADWQRLRAALALTIGIDSVVILKDACGLDNEGAVQLLRWTALTILEGALREAREREEGAEGAGAAPGVA